MGAHGFTIDKVAMERIHVVAGKNGNWCVVCQQAMPFAVSIWGSYQDAHHAARQLQIWMMDVLIDDRKARK